MTQTDITHRLRCKYPMGPTQENGEPEFGWREYGITANGSISARLMTIPMPLSAGRMLRKRFTEISQMDDRTLLELAAKAAGLGRIIWWEEQQTYQLIDQPNCPRWNPLTDDGDALRLAVKLRLSLDHNHSADQQRWVASDRNGCEGCYDPVSCVEDEFEENDRDAATRRAIVRAAAEIGRAMQ